VKDKNKVKEYVYTLYNNLENVIISKLVKKFKLKDSKSLSNYKDRINFENNKVFVDDKLFILFSDIIVDNPRIESRSVDLGVSIKIYN